mgnify:CR=1 FL=1
MYHCSSKWTSGAYGSDCQAGYTEMPDQRYPHIRSRNWRHLHWNALDLQPNRMSPFSNITKKILLLSTKRNMSFCLISTRLCAKCLPIDRHPAPNPLYNRLPSRCDSRLQRNYTSQTRKKRSLIPACSLLPGIPGKTGFPSESQYRRFTFQHGAGKLLVLQKSIQKDI